MDELLYNFQRTGSADDFRLIVNRHVNAVYSHALRRMRDPGAAEDVTQAVFVLLSQKAVSLPQGVVLGAWLFRATQYACLSARRAAARRQRHEREAAEMRDAMQSQSTPEISDLKEVLDDAIGGLSGKDREAVLMRYHEGHSMAEVGRRMGISEEAARKRLSRAVERLREILGHRGVAVESAALAVALEQAFTEQASVHLAGAIAAAASGTAAPSAGVAMIIKGTCKLILVQKIKVAATVVAGVLLAGAAVPATMQVMGRGAAPTTAPVAVQSPARNQELAQEVEDCLRRLLVALKANDVQAAYVEIHSTAPEERNVFKAALRVSMAMDQLRAAATEKFPDAPPALWDRDLTMSQVLERVLSLPPDPRDTITVDGDHVVTTAHFDAADVFGDQAVSAAQWAGAPNHFVRENGRWRWDTDRSLTFRIAGLANTAADPHAQEKMAVKVFDAMAETARETAAGIRAGKLTNQGAAITAFGSGVGQKLTLLNATNFRLDMLPAKK